MKFYPLTVSEVINETAQARSFRLRAAGEHAHLFGYRPGQFLTFRIPGEDRHIERCYSLSSAPACDAGMKVTVKRVAGGIGSNWFNDVPKPGDVIEVAPPGGRFVLRDRDRPPVLFAGGSGITPVISLIKQALHETALSPRLFYANTNEDQVIFRCEIDDLCARFPGRLECRHHLDAQVGLADVGRIGDFVGGRLDCETALSPRLFYANTDEDQVIFRCEIDDLCARFPGRLECRHHLDAQVGLADVGRIGDFVGGRLDCDFFICGPAPFMDLTVDVLDALGVADRHVFIERFTVAEDPGDTGDTVLPAAADSGVDAFRATLDGEDREIPYLAGETLLECMLAQGLDPAHSCKDAHCGSCMAIRKSGQVAMHKSTILSKRDKERGYILLCQAVPQSPDVWVDCDA